MVASTPVPCAACTNHDPHRWGSHRRQ
jgi:hypothetical protein